MKCATHPAVEAVATCSGCGSNLCDECDVSEKNSQALCVRCIAIQAVSDFTSQEKQQTEKLAKHSVRLDKKVKRGGVVKLAIVAIGLFVVPTQLMLRSDSAGYIESLELSDQAIHRCLNHFWEMSSLLKNGEVPAADLRCPVTNQPYLIEEQDGHIVIRDPNPELHGYSDMWISTEWTELVLVESPAI